MNFRFDESLLEDCCEKVLERIGKVWKCTLNKWKLELNCWNFFKKNRRKENVKCSWD